MADHYSPQHFIMSKRILKLCFAVFVLCFLALTTLFSWNNSPSSNAPAAVQSQPLPGQNTAPAAH